MTKRRWVKEPYKSVFEHPSGPVDLPVAIRRKPRRKFDLGEFCFNWFLRLFGIAVVLVAISGATALWIVRPLSDMGIWAYAIYTIGTL